MIKVKFTRLLTSADIRRIFTTRRNCSQFVQERIRNIGILAHIDAGK